MEAVVSLTALHSDCVRRHIQQELPPAKPWHILLQLDTLNVLSPVPQSTFSGLDRSSASAQPGMLKDDCSHDDTFWVCPHHCPLQISNVYFLLYWPRYSPQCPSQHASTQHPEETPPTQQADRPGAGKPTGPCEELLTCQAVACCTPSKRFPIP